MSRSTIIAIIRTCAAPRHAAWAVLGAAGCGLFAQAAGSYEPTWASLSKHEAAPEWFQDAKLGIYFHWGPYTVPAFGSEWYPCNMFREGSRENKHHIGTYGPVSEFGYEKFIPMFTAEHFDPAEWAELFKASGARFAGPVAEHHDGFAMWASKVNPWNAGDMGPKRDIVGELLAELKRRDLKTIATFHHARNGQRNRDKPDFWNGNGFDSHYPYHPDLPTATTDPKLRMLYGNFETIDAFNQYWLDQVEEVVDHYSPDILWYDSWLNMVPESYRLQMAAHFFNHAEKTGQEVVTCHKHNDMPLSFSVLDYEQGGRRDLHPQPWLTDITLSEGSWSYVEGQTYKDAAMVVRNMIDAWSKNGIVLLNISPRADGVINDEQRALLKAIGEWLSVHGEAVYGTRPFDTFGYGPAGAEASSHDGQSARMEYTAEDVRFTVSKDSKAMYIFFLGRPAPGSVVKIKMLGRHRYAPRSPVKRATLLDSGAGVGWEDDTYYFILRMPELEMNAIATVVKLELE